MQVLMKRGKKKTPACNIAQEALGRYLLQNDRIKSRKGKIQIREIEDLRNEAEDLPGC